MTRRKLVALVAAIVLFMIGFVVVGTSLFLTRSDYGRAKIREIGLPFLQRLLPNAKLYVGKVSGNLITGISIDSVAIRDLRDELFASTGRITLEWNWRDLIDYRVYVTRATVEHPYVHLIQHATGRWNFKEIFASNKPAEPEKPKLANTRGWGDYIVFDSVTAKNTTFLLTMPWQPDDTLRGAKRDSVINVHLTNPAKAVSRTFDGFGRTYSWRNGSGLISHIRLSDPDSNTVGKAFKIAGLSVDEYDPTFRFRNLRGDVRILGDSVWLDIPHFDMPASTGHGKGKVWWGSDLPVRYDIAVRGDSISLDDVNWVYPPLPRTGGGSLDLVIKNDAKDLHIVDFRLQNMDVRSVGSHLTGEMWFATGTPILLVRNVNLKADPITFDFIREINQKPFPYDWKGDIFGTAIGRGGPLNKFVIEAASGTFRDAHVPGAVSRFSGHGELDILQPAYTAFHSFNVDVQAVDLRTIEFLNKNFPRLGGIVYGTATLDSMWTDLRFSNANLFHQDGPGEPTHVTGEGRVTTAAVMEYDLTVDAQPLNATMIARSKPFETLPLRGLFSGPLRLKGTAPDLELATTLQSSAGSFSFDGRADIDSINGYAAHGRGQFSNLNIAALLEKTTLPPIGLLSGHYDIDVDSIDITPSSARGVAEVTLDRTIVDSIRVHPSELRVRFADGKMLIDSATIRTDAFTADLRGGIGLPQGSSDSLRFDITLDSLGGLRPLISHPMPAPGSIVADPDSLSGSAKISGVATGTFDALALRGNLAGSHLYYNKDRGDTLIASFDFQNALTPARVGTIVARTDSVTLGGIVIDTVGGRLQLGDSTHRAFTVGLKSRNGPTVVAGGSWTDSSMAQIIVVDSLNLTVGDDRWRLTSPAKILIDSSSTRVDSLLIRNSDSAFVAIMASVPSVGSAFAQLQARAIPLGDVSTIAQLTKPVRGTASASIITTGTKQAPVISASVRLSAIQRDSTVIVDSVRALASFDHKRLIADANAVRNGTAALTAHVSWPFDITLFSATQLNDSVDARIATPSTDLAAIAGLLSSKAVVDSVKGTLNGFLAVSGTTGGKIYRDSIRIQDGEASVKAAGVRFVGINGLISGTVGVSGLDSTQVALTVRSNSHDSAAVNGWVQNLAQLKNQPAKFDLRLTADTLHAFNRRTVAEVSFSTPQPLRLQGTLDAPVLTGQINIDRGAIFLSDPDLARKLSVETLAELGDSTSQSTSAMFTRLMTNINIQSVPVTLGEDVRLRSSEADVRLAGQLELVKSNASTRLMSPTGEFVPGLSLTGDLRTTGGTYNLNFGVVQREFNVLQGGTVTFDGTSPETPLLDIKAQYNVKRVRDRDLAVIVNLAGRLPTPQITFTSDNEYALNTSDLLSYLIIGQPGFDFASSGFGNVLSPTVSAFIADKLRNTTFGSFVSSFQLEFGTAQTQSGTNQSAIEYLRTATLDFGVPVYRNVFLGVNAGYCQLFEGKLQGLGAKVEYRFRPDMSLQAAYDPAAFDTRTNCNSQSFLGLVPSPAQFSFSVRKTWRF